MTRGKYAQRAETRRDWSALEAERDAALLRAGRAEEERARLAANAEVSMAALRADVEKLRTHVAAGTSSEVERLRAQVEEQRKEIGQLQDQLRKTHEVRLKSEKRLEQAIAATFNVSLPEAGELVTGAVSGVAPDEWDAGDLASGRHGSVRMTPHRRRLLDPAFVAVERARGKRRTASDFTGVGCQPDAWIVHRGDQQPRLLVALFSNEADASAHADHDPDLHVEEWSFLDRIVP